MTDYYAEDVKDILEITGLNVLAELSGKTVLLTGAAGFLGRWIVRTLAALNNHLGTAPPVRAILVDAVATDAEEFLALGRGEFSFIHHNLTQPMRLNLNTQLDYVIHAAGIASPYWYRRDPLATIDVAVHGARQCLELAKKNQARYLFLSSSEVYQTAEVVPTPETYVGAIPTMGPRSCYDVSKALGETLGHVYFTQFGVNAGGVRIFNAFGPGMRENDHRILPRVLSSVLSKKPLRVFKEPGFGRIPLRTYCPVANTVAGILLALIRGPADAIYNIGAPGPEISVPALIVAVDQALAHLHGDLSVPWEFATQVGVYAHEPMRRCPNIDKARIELGFEPRVSLDRGLARFVAWAVATYTGVEHTE